MQGEDARLTLDVAVDDTDLMDPEEAFSYLAEDNTNPFFEQTFRKSGFHLRRAQYRAQELVFNNLRESVHSRHRNVQ